MSTGVLFIVSLPLTASVVFLYCFAFAFFCSLVPSFSGVVDLGGILVASSVDFTDVDAPRHRGWAVNGTIAVGFIPRVW